MSIIRDLIYGLALGVIQGLTEVFPVSSPAHMVIYSSVLGQQISFNEILFLHMATFTAILLYFWSDIAGIFTDPKGRKLIIFILCNLLATAAVGLLLERIANLLVTRADLVANLLILNGLMLVAMSIFSNPGTRSMADLSLIEFLFIGLIQGVATLPGISRLGIVLAGSLWRRMKWSEAIKFSFIISLPTILSANLFKIVQLAMAGKLSWNVFANPPWLLPMQYYLVRTLVLVVAFGCGLFGLNILNRTIYLGRRLLLFFGLYCIIGGFFFWQFLSIGH